MGKELRIIVAGGRDFHGYILLSNTLDEHLNRLDPSQPITVVSGGARGADRLGEMYATCKCGYNLNLKRFPADWEKYGKKAGYIRNRQMAEFAAETGGVLFAFWDGKSRGTKNMIDLAKQYGLEVHVISY